MKNNLSGKLWLLVSIATLMLYLASCSKDDSATPSGSSGDDQYLQGIVENGTGSDHQDDADLLYNESADLNDGGAVANDDNSADRTIDSLKKWGRKIEKVKASAVINHEGDSVVMVKVTRTITGTYQILEYTDSGTHLIQKPYTEVIKRAASFKRIAHSGEISGNWKLYTVSMADGQSTSPQTGSDYVQINKVEVTVNGTPAYTFNGPNFKNNVFTTTYFGGAGIPALNPGDKVDVKVYTYSKQSEPDIVAWHWPANTFGFHRVPFTMVSQTPDGAYWDRLYEKSFTIYTQHPLGRYNAFISASTYKSLYDDSPVEFASDLVGTPYKVVK